jgi:hypothetical protein
VWAGSLGVSLGILAAGARGEEIRWRPARTALPQPAAVVAPAARLGPPIATLGRPVPVADDRPEPAPATDPGLTRAGFSTDVPAAPRAIRGQSPELAAPSLVPPPGVPPVPGSPDERYNCGVVTDLPGAGAGPKVGWFGKCKDWCNGLFSGGAGFGNFGLTGANRALFQSDHAFDQFASPVSDPFFFEDPRSLTEVRPIFIYQQAPGSQYVFRGGDIEYFGTQARVAITDRLSFVMNKFGGIWQEPHFPFDGFAPHAGFSEIWLGPKYTFLRCESTGTVAAAGLTFQIPAGSGRVFQDTGVLTLNPYVSIAQTFGRSSYGSFNFMNTSALAFATDDKRSDYFYSSFHLDYNVLNRNKYYPLIEMNWTHYNEAGSANAFGFEGRDLFNFGSTAVSGRNYLTMALGARYKYNECIQFGLAVGTPIINPRDLYGFRITTDLIFRY